MTSEGYLLMSDYFLVLAGECSVLWGDRCGSDGR